MNLVKINSIQSALLALSAALALVVQTMPSGLVITLLPEPPVYATATKRAASGAQHIAAQLLPTEPVRSVQVMPSGLLITHAVVPLAATATNRPNAGDQQTLRHVMFAAADLNVQTMPFGLVITFWPAPP